MALSEADRVNTMRQLVRKLFVETNQTATFDTDQIKVAVDAVDDWVDANQASYNSALPNPFKTNATPAQKALVLTYVALKRTGVL